VAENNTRDIKSGTAAIVTHAGVPLAYGHSRFLATASELTPPWLMDVRHIRNAGDNLYYNKFFPFGSEVLFIPNKVCGEEQFQFQPKAAVGRFLGYIVNSGCPWSSAYIVAHAGGFA
jgi:hypothetical protein